MNGAGKKAASVAVSAVALATLMGAAPAAAEGACVYCEPGDPGAVDPFDKWVSGPASDVATYVFGKIAPEILENVFIKSDLDPGRTADVFSKM